MKKNRNSKKIIIFITTLVILLGLNTIYSYSAENNTTNTNSNTNTANNSTNSTNTNISTNSSKNTTTNTSNASNNSTTKKSNNANLSNLGIKPNDFSGFKTGTLSYDVTVPENVEKVEVYAKAQNSKAKVSGTGNKELEIGENKLDVVVTAEDGTKKTYTINVTRSGETENNEKENNSEEIEGLSELKINDVKLTPEFKTDVYEYTAKYIGENTSLQIETNPTNTEYKVEITGNEDLKEGENLITILVNNSKEENVATYQITINKSLVDEELVAKEKAEKEKQQKMLLIGGIVLAFIIIAIIFLIIRHRRNKQFAEEYTIPYSGLNDDDENYDIDNFDGEYEDDEEYEENTDNKETIREKFLNNYNSKDSYDYEEEIEEEKPKRNKHKGKRFK